jgi:hypothetical protein
MLQLPQGILRPRHPSRQDQLQGRQEQLQGRQELRPRHPRHPRHPSRQDQLLAEGATNANTINESPSVNELCIAICGNNGGPHHDLPVSAAARQCRAAAGFEPAVQRAFFGRSGAPASTALLQSRVANCMIIASK